MSFWTKIFGRKNKVEPVGTFVQTSIGSTLEFVKACEFNTRFQGLLSQQRYISRKDYASLYPEYQDIFVFFDKLRQSGMLNTYVETHHLDIKQIEHFHQHIQEIKDIQRESCTIKSHNDAYIAERLIAEKQ